VQALRLGHGTIGIEDYGGIEQTGEIKQRYLGTFPFFDLKTAIMWSSSKSGIAVVETPSEYISSQCPICGNVNPKQHNYRTGVFHCSKEDCGFERDADFVAAFNMLDRLGGATIRREKLKREHALRRLALSRETEKQEEEDPKT
jgi:transposase